MDSPQSELEAIRRSLRRADNPRIPNRAAFAAGSAVPSSASVPGTRGQPGHSGDVSRVSYPAVTTIADPLFRRGLRLHPPPEIATDLESRIGSHWLNRIGIAAVLIGVSYFLKFAFDNNWIGPAGRVAIGLLAGIAIVVWSEGFRAKGLHAFSYSLKAVGIGMLYLSL